MIESNGSTSLQATFQGNANAGGYETSFFAAMDYTQRGWAVLPMLPGTKRAGTTWKEHRQRRGAFDQEQISRWFNYEFPNGGVALMLGPPSGVLSVDVDGKDPFDSFRHAVGVIPITPTIKSGNPDPFRLQYLFRMPEDFPTQASVSPLCEGLEFRGDGGLSILPPSIHPSGNRYRWLPGLSPDLVPIADLPPTIAHHWAAEMRERQARKTNPVTSAIGVTSIDTTLPDGGNMPGLFGCCSMKTRQFLLGMFANGPQWNQRLFNAACDLAGNKVPWEIAVEYLLAGAKPWSDEDHNQAIKTIESAFDQEREPAQLWGLRRTLSCFRRSAE